MLVAELESLRDHWWWRPGWEVGRSFYTWHVTFTDQPELARLHAAYAALLAGLPQLDAIPLRWLHLTTQGIGFTHQVNRSEVEQMVDAARERCATLEPVSVTVGPAEIEAEAFYLPVRPAEPLVAVRHALRAAIADVWGAHRVPEAADGFRPHVSLAYTNAAGPAEPVADALAAESTHSANLTVTAVSLIDLNRDRKMYEWTEVATIPLGG